MSDGLPDDWTVVTDVEEVPNPNFGTPYGVPYFRRMTTRVLDGAGVLQAASGDRQDAINQALSLVQCSFR